MTRQVQGPAHPHHKKLRLVFAIAAALAVIAGVASTPARPALYVAAPVMGAIVTGMDTGMGRRRTLIAVWHDASHPEGVARRLLGVGTTPATAGAMARSACGLPGFSNSATAISLQPEAIGVLDTAEAWRLLAHCRASRLDNQVGATVWFVTDAASPLLLVPGESALGFATTRQSARRVVFARRRESLGEPTRVRWHEIPVDQLLWPEGTPEPLRGARPLHHKDTRVV
ncbi:hypothetical protein [Cellulomonas aerilata]|uniref:Uncharacterized protein n=1 Tax=Cellulomonas aerilata TaxID=515326 RepID=A0A512DEQ9_9CELL|nr:hypothetical protein [Cellulomonas aerilata]GEO34959.1 hypothetical protein CAE01nite_26840 [Cellulomonas aerilata]